MSGFSINTVTISGNLTRDPELRAIPSGTSVCQLGVAVNERVKNNATGEWGDRANFFDVTVWGGLGESIARQCHKGMGVAVAGRLRFESWEKDGQKRSKVSIVADSVVPIPREGQGGGGQGGSSYGPGQPEPGGQYAGAGAPSGGGYGGGGTTPPPGGYSNDDIPF